MTNLQIARAKQKAYHLQNLKRKADQELLATTSLKDLIAKRPQSWPAPETHPDSPLA